MDTSQIRKLVKEYGAVVLVEEGHPPLIVRELQPTEASEEEVPISARWPKSLPAGKQGPPITQDSVLERLNKEILALKEQIAQEESQVGMEVRK
jgi:hypothetical protein